MKTTISDDHEYPVLFNFVTHTKELIEFDRIPFSFKMPEHSCITWDFSIKLRKPEFKYNFIENPAATFHYEKAYGIFVFDPDDDTFVVGMLGLGDSAHEEIQILKDGICNIINLGLPYDYDNDFTQVPKKSILQKFFSIFKIAKVV